MPFCIKPFTDSFGPTPILVSCTPLFFYFLSIAQVKEFWTAMPNKILPLYHLKSKLVFLSKYRIWSSILLLQNSPFPLLFFSSFLKIVYSLLSISFDLFIIYWVLPSSLKDGWSLGNKIKWSNLVYNAPWIVISRGIWNKRNKDIQWSLPTVIHIGVVSHTIAYH